MILLILSLSTTSFAQNDTSSTTQAPRKSFTTIIYAGLAGAILGLSTLSFHGRPQDHMDDIAVGFAVGIIAGAVYVSYRAATEPSTLYGTEHNKFEAIVAKDTLYSKSKQKVSFSFFEYTF